MVRKKPKSKRVTLKDKYKVERKVKEHNKKMRKEAKKNPQLRKKLNKDPGIPNLWPFKEHLIQKMQIEKQEAEKAKESKKRKRTQEEQMSDLTQSANQRTEQFEERTRQILGSYNIKDSSKKSFFKEFKKVVKAADIILEVLDARDPVGSRSPTIERQILEMDPNKKIILILNKIDLVPKENVLQWLSCLRDEYPTIAFKASTQKQKKNLGQARGKAKELPDSMLTSNKCLGAETLLQLLKNYTRSLDIKNKISVGIIGFPNVGKSSLINSLKRTKAVGVGSRAGHTKVLSEIVLDKHITLLDCPGIIFSSDMSETDAALRNCVNFEQLEDYMMPVQAILNRCSHQAFQQIYKIPEFKDGAEFLRHVAQKRGRVLRGGIPSEESGARIVLKDWNSGKIPFYTLPPDVEAQAKIRAKNAKIVSQWGEQFKLSEIMETEKSEIFDQLNTNTSALFASQLKPESFKPDDIFMRLADEDEEDDDDDMEYNDDDNMENGDDDDGEDDDEDDVEEEEEDQSNQLKRKTPITVIAPIKEKRKEEPPLKRRKTDPELEAQRNTTAKRQYQQEQKLIKKETKKDQQGQPEVEDDTYDFGIDFWKGANVASSKTDENNNDEPNAFSF
eukprot:TRINITY_DN2449_c0_g2_i1.p1 TRINITY_DN2449_c0_g2~~TRINITY_DN2449_c0_g2_i1.p1  ORF type:complete len:617 (+),score=182.44 TRINITY_DN2449_c0_g2_i1:44-1894(+)